MPLAIACRHDNLSEAINDPDSVTRQLWTDLQDLHGQDSSAINFRDLIYVGVRDTEDAENVTMASKSIPVISTAEVRSDGAIKAANRCLSHLAEADLIYELRRRRHGLNNLQGHRNPSPWWIWAHEAVLLLRTLLADSRVCCWEIVKSIPISTSSTPWQRCLWESSGLD